MTASALESRAREFAGDLSTLLNRTVCDGARLSTVLTEPSLCRIAPGITKRQLVPSRLPLSLGRKATGYLFVAYILELDQEETFLTVNKSGVGLYAEDDTRSMVFHYDYDRLPPNEYPNPHFQVAGESATLQATIDQSGSGPKSLRDMHFPVGGRRFRPTIEDVVEVLIIEGLAAARDGWAAAVEERREAWREAQLKAAVRRYPDWATDSLRRLGYHVEAPPEPGESR